MHISIEFVTVDSIINFQAALSFLLIMEAPPEAAVTTLAEQVSNILPPCSVHTGTILW